MIVTQAKPGWVRTELKIGTEHINNHNVGRGLDCTDSRRSTAA